MIDSEWKNKAVYCGVNSTSKGHDWMPISKAVTKSAEHVTVIMCKKCFLRVNLQEVFEKVCDTVCDSV